MTESLDGLLLLATEKVRRKRKLEGMLRYARQTLRELTVRKANLAEQLEKERLDVARLHGMTLTAMFHSVLGSREDRINQERQELVAAQLKYDAARGSLSACQRNCDYYQGLIAELGDIEREYESLLAQKRLLLVQSGDAKAVELSKIESELAQQEGLVRELKEAMQAGVFAVEALDMVRSSLASARNWGTWDLVGGGTIVSIAKHSQLDDARRRAMMAQERLRKFRAELADAGERLGASLRIDGFTTFADVFFDNLITDWVVQNEIHRASDACARVVGEVRDAIRVCRQRLDEATAESARLIERRKEMIVSG